MRPALAVVKPERLRYEEKSSVGVKRTRGKACRGRACSAVTSVASSEGGSEEAVSRRRRCS